MYFVSNVLDHIARSVGRKGRPSERPSAKLLVACVTCDDETGGQWTAVLAIRGAIAGSALSSCDQAHCCLPLPLARAALSLPLPIPLLGANRPVEAARPL